jgi:predicted RNase H-like HicB family nuclease
MLTDEATERREKALRYAVTIEPLSESEGGGFVAIVHDLPVCMSDGATPEDALANVRDAIEAWIKAAQDLGHIVPEPSTHHASERARLRSERDEGKP